MPTNFPASPSKVKVCKRGHDWETNKRSNGSNGKWCCKECRKYVWDAENNIVNCSIPDCNNPMADRKSALCYMHRWRLKKYGSPTIVSRVMGKGHINKDGYKEVRVNNRKMFEHRYIMEIHLKRKLYEHEEVHHKNGLKADNRWENLELWSHSQPNSQRVEDKIAWAEKFLAQYGSKVV